MTVICAAVSSQVLSFWGARGVFCVLTPVFALTPSPSPSQGQSFGGARGVCRVLTPFSPLPPCPLLPLWEKGEFAHPDA